MASAAAGGGDGGDDAVASKRTLAIPLIHGHTVELLTDSATGSVAPLMRPANDLSVPPGGGGERFVALFGRLSSWPAVVHTAASLSVPADRLAEMEAVAAREPPPSVSNGLRNTAEYPDWFRKASKYLGHFGGWHFTSGVHGLGYDLEASKPRQLQLAAAIDPPPCRAPPADQRL